MQESLPGAPWDFGPVFAALAKPYPNQVQKEQAGYFESHRIPSSSLSRVPPAHVDNYETPKATPADDSISSLGDLSNALLCLGYSVEITAPTAPESASLTTSDIDVNGPRNETSLRELGEESNFEAIEGKLSENFVANTKLAAKRAETRRRAVLQSFLGPSLNNSQESGISQKLSKQKVNGVPDHKDAAIEVALPKFLSSPRKRVDMHLSAEKKVQLTLQLHKCFPESQHSFYNTGTIPGSTAVPDTEGIHVFVDISNVCELQVRSELTHCQ